MMGNSPFELANLATDHWHGDVSPHLAQPCYEVLGQALIWGLYKRNLWDIKYFPNFPNYFYEMKVLQSIK